MRVFSLPIFSLWLFTMAQLMGQSGNSLVRDLQDENERLRAENRMLREILERRPGAPLPPGGHREMQPGESPDAAQKPKEEAASATASAQAIKPPVGALYDEFGKFRNSYADAILIIEGDKSVGTGFIAKTSDKTYLYTAAHVLSGNSKLTIKNSSGQKFTKFGQMETAEGADLARVEILEDAPGLRIGTSKDAVQINLEIAALGNGGGKGVMAVELGKILGTSGENIEVDAQIIQGNSGGPVVDLKTGEVLGVATHLTAEKKDVWSEGTRQGNVRRFACRMDKQWNWKSVAIGKFLAEGRLLEDYDRVTRLCIALSMLDPGVNGMRFNLEVAANRSAAEVFDENDNLSIVQDLYAMNRELVAKKIAVSEMDLKKRFRSIIARALTLANSDKGALAPATMSWFHAQGAESSMKFRQEAIEELNDRSNQLK